MTDLTQYRRDDALSGRCLCGAVHIEIDGAHVGAVGACHCAMCRRWSGTVMSDFAERVFCGTCGSHLWFRDTQDGAPYEFVPGIFAGADGFPLISEIYIDRAPGYARLDGDHVRKTRADYEARKPFVEGDDP